MAAVSRYDGFGNVVNMLVTEGPGSSPCLSPDPCNNRLGSGHPRERGHPDKTPTLNLTYDVANRTVQAAHSMNGTDMPTAVPVKVRDLSGADLGVLGIKLDQKAVWIDRNLGTAEDGQMRCRQ